MTIEDYEDEQFSVHTLFNVYELTSNKDIFSLVLSFISFYFLNPPSFHIRIKDRIQLPSQLHQDASVSPHFVPPDDGGDHDTLKVKSGQHPDWGRGGHLLHIPPMCREWPWLS